MAKIVKLSRRPRQRDSEHRELLDIAVGLRSVQQAARLVASDVEHAIETIQTQLVAVRDQIKALPDAEVSERLARDHAILTGALQSARETTASILKEQETQDVPALPAERD